MKVLVVDDNKNDRMLLLKLLVSSGYEAAEATNGNEALEYIRTSKPGLIVSDIMMPEMDGYTLLRKLKKNDESRDIPFVFYTAHYVGEKDRKLAFSLGASRCIVKPVEPHDLLIEIEAVLKEYEAGLIAPVEPLIETEEEYLKLYSDRLFRKLEEKYSELEDTKNFLDAVLGDMGDGVIVADPDLNVIYCNKRMHDILECDLPFGTKAPDALHPPCIPDMAHASHEPFEVEQTARKGNMVQLEGIISPAINETGKLTFHIGVFRDVTERNRVQVEVERNHREIATLYELDRLFSDCTSSDELVTCALDRVIDVMDLEGGVIHLINEGEGRIEIKGYTGLPPKFMELIQQQSLDNPAVQKALEHDTPVMVSPLSTRIPGLTESVQEYGEERIITIQLTSRGKVIGLADLMLSPQRELSGDEMMLLEKFGMQFGVALENFLMYEELKQEVMKHKQAED